MRCLSPSTVCLGVFACKVMLTSCFCCLAQVLLPCSKAQMAFGMIFPIGRLHVCTPACQQHVPSICDNHAVACAVLSLITRHEFSLYTSHLSPARPSIHSFTGTLTHCFSLMRRPTTSPPCISAFLPRCFCV